MTKRSMFSFASSPLL